jgi:hypothetical protein
MADCVLEVELSRHNAHHAATRRPNALQRTLPVIAGALSEIREPFAPSKLGSARCNSKDTSLSHLSSPFEIQRLIMGPKESYQIRLVFFRHL